MNFTTNEIKKMTAEIEEYIKLDNSENGEANGYLVDLLRYSYILDENLVGQLYDELHRQLVWYKENTDIVETPETRTITVRHLEYKDD